MTSPTQPSATGTSRRLPASPFQFRPFDNSDPPAIVEIWNRQPRQRGLLYPISVGQFETTTLCKTYFDRRGLILATQDERPVGFVHAGFGPADEKNWLTTDLGVTCMLMVLPELWETSLPAELLARSEEYLRRRGAKVLYGGGIRPLDPFYRGLYGGSELPGVLDSDRQQQELFKSHGYNTIDEVHVLHCGLEHFRGVMNRVQFAHRRNMSVQTVYDPRSRSWWEACTAGTLDRERLVLVSKKDERAPLAAATFWNMEPLASSWQTRVCGLTEIEVDSLHRREGLATYLLGESFKQLRGQGVELIETQAMHNNLPARGLYEKLGFVEVDHGTVLRKAS